MSFRIEGLVTFEIFGTLHRIHKNFGSILKNTSAFASEDERKLQSMHSQSSHGENIVIIEAYRLHSHFHPPFWSLLLWSPRDLECRNWILCVALVQINGVH